MSETKVRDNGSVEKDNQAWSLPDVGEQEIAVGAPSGGKEKNVSVWYATSTWRRRARRSTSAIEHVYGGLSFLRFQRPVTERVSKRELRRRHTRADEQQWIARGHIDAPFPSRGHRNDRGIKPEEAVGYTPEIRDGILQGGAPNKKETHGSENAASKRAWHPKAMASGGCPWNDEGREKPDGRFHPFASGK